MSRVAKVEDGVNVIPVSLAREVDVLFEEAWSRQRRRRRGTVLIVILASMLAATVVATVAFSGWQPLSPKRVSALPPLGPPTLSDVTTIVIGPTDLTLVAGSRGVVETLAYTAPVGSTTKDLSKVFGSHPRLVSNPGEPGPSEAVWSGFTLSGRFDRPSVAGDSLIVATARRVGGVTIEATGDHRVGEKYESVKADFSFRASAACGGFTGFGYRPFYTTAGESTFDGVFIIPKMRADVGVTNPTTKIDRIVAPHLVVGC